MTPKANKNCSTPNTTIAQMVAIALLIEISFVSFSKGLNSHIWVWAEPYYFIDYHSGFMKRALIGEIFRTLFSSFSQDQIRSSAVVIYFMTFILLLNALIFWLICLHRAMDTGILLAIFAVFATSQFFPRLANDVGCLDIYIYLMFLIATLAFMKRMLLAVCAIGIVAPFIHELFIFIWLTLVLLALWQRVGKHELLTLIVPFFGAAIVQLFHSQQAAIIQVMAAPLTESVKHDLINYQFGQGLVWIIGVMLSKFYNYYFNAIQAFAYFCAPSIVMVLAYGVSRGSLRDVGFLAAATFAPLAILGVAWDLSRMLCMTPFTALLSIYYMQSTKPETVVRGIKVESAVNIAVSASSMLFILLPFVYAYFEVAAVIDRGFIRFDWTSIGEFVTHAVEDYSHKN